MPSFLAVTGKLGQRPDCAMASAGFGPVLVTTPEHHFGPVGPEHIPPNPEV